MWVGNAGGGRLNCWSSFLVVGFFFGLIKFLFRFFEWKEVESINVVEEKIKK